MMATTIPCQVVISPSTLTLVTFQWSLNPLGYGNIVATFTHCLLPQRLPIWAISFDPKPGTTSQIVDINNLVSSLQNIYEYKKIVLCVQVVEVVVKPSGIGEEGRQPSEVPVEQSVKHIESLHLGDDDDDDDDDEKCSPKPLP